MGLRRPSLVDTRVVSFDYKGHKLMSRYWHQQYRGWVWKDNKLVVDFEGTNIDRTIDSLISIVDCLTQEHRNG